MRVAAGGAVEVYMRNGDVAVWYFDGGGHGLQQFMMLKFFKVLQLGL